MKKLLATLKTMSFKEAIDYIWEYYKIHIFGIIIGGFFIISITSSIISGNEETYNIMAISNVTYNDTSELSEQLNDPGFEEYKVTVDSLGPGGGNLSDQAPQQVQKFFARIAAGSLDMIVTNREVAEQLHEQQGLTKMKEIVDLEKFKSAGVELYQFNGDDVYAIDTNHFKVFNENELFQNKYLIIPLSAENKEKSKLFLETLLDS